MKLTLTRPLAFFDLETTGLNIGKDKIVEISILKIFQNGNKESRTWLVNPEIEIPKEATEVHGITNEKVANEPSFKELANDVFNMIDNCDLAGFNSNRFDVPLLVEELMRAGIYIEMKNIKLIDVQTIFHKKEKRTLSAGYKFYCDKELEDAHSAEADARASYEILLAQIEKYDDLENSIDALSEYSTLNNNNRADLAGFLLFNKDHKEIFSFGKFKGSLVEEVIKNNSGYYRWIQNAEFPLYTKKVLKEIKERSTKKETKDKEEKLESL